MTDEKTCDITGYQIPNDESATISHWGEGREYKLCVSTLQFAADCATRFSECEPEPEVKKVMLTYAAFLRGAIKATEDKENDTAS